MKIFDLIKKTDGFTIQEILVVLLVGSILVSLSLALFQFTNELFQMWYGSTEMKSDANRILHAIALDVQRSREVIEKTDSTLIVSREIGRIVKYSYDGKTLLRNDVDLSPKKMNKFKIWIDEITEKGQFQRTFRIKILTVSKWINYESEIVAMTSYCSKSGFRTAFK